MSGFMGLMLGSNPGPLTATASSGTVSTSGNTSTITTGTVTVTVRGGYPPYTYSWVKSIGDAITATAPAAATTAFQATGMSSPEGRTALFDCTVTDVTLASTVASPEVDVNIDRI